MEEEQRDHVEYQVFPPSMQKARREQSQVVSLLYGSYIEHIAPKEILMVEAMITDSYSGYKNAVEENVCNHVLFRNNIHPHCNRDTRQTHLGQTQSR